MIRSPISKDIQNPSRSTTGDKQTVNSKSKKDYYKNNMITKNWLAPQKEGPRAGSKCKLPKHTSGMKIPNIQTQIKYLQVSIAIKRTPPLSKKQSKYTIEN